VPLPEAHLGVGAVGLVMSGLRPRRITWEPAQRIGWPLLFGGVALAAWATRAAGATDLARPDQLITDGPYAVSRHPMYVAWTAILLGMALVIRAGWLLLLMPLLAVLIHREARREEERLAEVFGVDYRMYQARVRRYL
jgi:protein-S-isoprenylcysteine O-methyltransferase Ste14